MTERTCIVEFTTIVWSWEQRHQLSFRKELVTIFDDLMRSAYQIKVVSSQKLTNNLRTT